jgi:Ca-activated chloride channel family protein
MNVFHLRLFLAISLIAGSNLSAQADTHFSTSDLQHPQETANGQSEAPSSEDSDAGETTEPVIILFDRSASMKKKMDGVSRVDIARDSLINWSHKLNGRKHVGIRFFAGGTSKDDDESNCLANEQVVGLGETISLASITQLAEGIQAIGHKTNIAYALEMAKEELRGKGPGRIILITDGQENCERDPMQQASELGKMDIKVNVVGIGDAKDVGGLGKIALQTGGQFDLATNGMELRQKLSDSLPNFDLPDLSTPPADSAGSAGTLVQIIDVLGGHGRIPAVPAPLSEPLVLETMKVSDSGPQRIAIELILDVSGSMAAKLDNRSKMEIAKRALAETLDGLKDSVFLVGLRAYGFDSTLEKTKETSCPNTALLTAISSNNLRTIGRAASRLIPYGYTPIADSLLKAGGDLQAIEADSRMIILITDGEETCGGDPIATAKRLCEIGIELETNIIGFDLEPATADVMRKAAKAGCGSYVDARNAWELTEGLKAMVTVARDKVDPTWLRAIHPIEGGATIETAVSTAPGTYTLNRWLEKGEQMYFRIDTVKAQHAFFRGLIQSHRLVGSGKDMTETTFAQAQYRLTIYLPGYDSTDPRAKKKTRYMRISGLPGTFRSIGQQDPLGRGIVFSIGSQYDRVHADSLFNVEIRESGDVVEGYEAPENITKETATLKVEKELIGHLGEGDFVDMFALPELPGGAEIDITISNPEFSAKIELLNSKGRRILRKLTVGGRTSIGVQPDSDIRTLVIKSRNPKLRQQFTDYSIIIKPF